MNWLDKFEDDFHTLASICCIVVGNIIYAVSINVLITPMGMYNGGFLGLAQLLRYFLLEVLHLSMPTGIDVTGIIYFLMNVPLFFYAYKAVGLRFSIKSLVSIGLSSLCLTFVPVPAKPLFNDYLTACVVAGVIGGLGSGFILRGGSSTGGSDIIGVCLSKTRPNVSVGGINIAMNLVVYGLCLIVFNVQIAVYSFIYTTIRSVFMDRMHAQNINTEVMIITKIEGIDKILIKDLDRGVTKWRGKGAYTEDDVNIMMTLVSKYEVGHLKSVVLEQDPHAFIMISEGENIVGNFKQHMQIGK